MSFGALLRTRWRAVALVAALEAAVAWAFAWFASARILAPLAHHPDGANALPSEGGRLAIDLLLHHDAALIAVARQAALVVVLYALAAVVLGAFLPGAFVGTTAPRVRAVARVALARTPGLLALSCLAGVGYGLAGVLAWVATRFTLAASNAVEDPRASLAVALTGLLPGVFVAYTVLVWRELARAHLVAEGRGAMAAARDGLDRVRRAPRATLGAYAVCGLGSSALAAGGFAATAWHASTPLALTVVLAGVQQATLAGRVLVAAWWSAYVTRRWRASSQNSP